MSSKSKIYGTVFFARQESGIVSHLSVPDHPSIDALERAMRVDFDAETAAGGSSVRLQFTETLDNALVDPCGGPDLDGVIAASALGLLRLYGRESLSVVDQGNQYKYVPVEDGEDALRSLQVFGRPVGRPVTSRRLH